MLPAMTVARTSLSLFTYCLVQVFTAIFAMEATLKIMALGLFRYLKDRWNGSRTAEMVQGPQELLRSVRRQPQSH